MGGETGFGANGRGYGKPADLDGNLVALLNPTPDLTEGEVVLFGRLQRARNKRS